MKEVSLPLDLLSLLRGEINVTAIVLHEPMVRLERLFNDGEYSTSAATRLDTGQTFASFCPIRLVPTVLHIEDGRISYRQRTGATFALDGIHGDLTVATPAGPLP